MKRSFPKPILSEKILIFINHCLPDIKYKFSYQEMAEIFKRHYDVNYSVKTLRKEFSNLKRQGYISGGTRYGKTIPLLTRKGRLRITPRLPYKKFGHWDGKWRLCIFCVPEEDRRYRTVFQNELRKLGFQIIQTGVHISPYPLLGTINRISGELGIRQYLTLIETDKIDREQSSVQKIWNIWAINREYHQFIVEAGKALRQAQGKKFWVLSAKRLEQKFFEIYQKDPHLPKELLPKDWLGDAAYQKYKELIHSY